ncbi:hypothetical protein AUL38_15965 [Leucobacter sp. G161]|nr:hypothetical protein AUL38_15965 [Leucobacter sp. G161]
MGAAYCLLIFLGGIGLHRFYLDNDARGFVMVALFLLTVVFAVVFPPVSVLCLITLWIMQIIDLFTLAADVTRFNARLYSGM